MTNKSPLHSLLALIFLFSFPAFSLAQPFVTIHFLYGSKPAKAFKGEEPKWFGGKRGGHVGLEWTPGHVLSFGPSGKFHRIAHRRDFHSAFTDVSVEGCLTALGNRKGDLQTASIQIPVTAAQFQCLDSLATRYLNAPPFDYAFLGMRCASATDWVLSRAGMLKARSYRTTLFRTFRPRALRKRLLHMAEVNGWKVSRTQGSTRRIWEKDIRW
ncbi:MAG: hypothetical protein U0176_06880 [Bacteroidia bacterium]